MGDERAILLDLARHDQGTVIRALIAALLDTADRVAALEEREQVLLDALVAQGILVDLR